MPSNEEQKLKELETRVKRVNDEKIRLETQLEELRKRRDTLIAELQEMGIPPESLSTQIANFKQQLETELNNIEGQIPEGF